ETPIMDRPDAQMNEADTASQAAADRMMESGSAGAGQDVNSYSYMSQSPTYSDRLAGTTIGGGYAAEELLVAKVVDQRRRTICSWPMARRSSRSSISASAAAPARTIRRSPSTPSSPRRVPKAIS